VGSTLIYVQSRGPLALVCVRVSDGDVLWKRPLDVDATQLTHVDKYDGMFQAQMASPVVAGSWIVGPGVADRLVTIHTETGEILWNKPVMHADGPASGATTLRHLMPSEYATGVIVDDNRLFASAANGYVVAVDLTTGRRLWQFRAARTPCVDVVAYHRGRANSLTRPVVAHGHLWTAGADGFLYGLDLKTGRSAVSFDVGTAVTVAPLPTETGVLLFGVDGSIQALSVGV
jgi:outer membrane protein assembly factor BamB